MKGTYQYEEGIEVYYYIPNDIGADEELPILFVLPGMPRNAGGVLKDMLEEARSQRVILLLPKFDFEKYPPDMYNRGNIVKKSSTKYKYIVQEDSTKYTFKKFKGIFNDFVKRFDLKNTNCDIYGFSAGAQTLWTFLQFGTTEDLSFVNGAFPFSAGRYCFPSNKWPFPYGIKEFESMSDEDLKRFFSFRITMGVGLLDDDPQAKNLPNDELDNVFGDNRVDRARNYYKFCRNLAKEKNIPFNWDFIEVAGIAHNNCDQRNDEGKVIARGMAEVFLNFYCNSRGLCARKTNSEQSTKKTDVGILGDRCI